MSGFIPRIGVCCPRRCICWSNCCRFKSASVKSTSAPSPSPCCVIGCTVGCGVGIGVGVGVGCVTDAWVCFGACCSMEATVISKARGDAGGMRPGTPAAPYAWSYGMMTARVCPAAIPQSPSDHPGICPRAPTTVCVPDDVSSDVPQSPLGCKKKPAYFKTIVSPRPTRGVPGVAYVLSWTTSTFLPPVRNLARARCKLNFLSSSSFLKLMLHDCCVWSVKLAKLRS